MAAKRYDMHSPPVSQGCIKLFQVCVIAKRFSGGVPTIRQLQAEFGMSRPTAYRWRGAMLAAWGEPK